MMNTPHIEDPLRRNRNGGHDMQAPRENSLGGIWLGAHRDPKAFLNVVHALNRLLRAAGTDRFSPCTDPCPLCHSAFWLSPGP